MSQIIKILMFEEGYKERPYRDTQGYPTVGCGIKIGPKMATLDNYIFTLPLAAGEAWIQAILDALTVEINRCSPIQKALSQCNPPRADVLYSMAYQLGVNGLSAFKDALLKVTKGDFSGAADAMQNSLWARQTPQRAQRHADVMRSGTYGPYQEVI